MINSERPLSQNYGSSTLAALRLMGFFTLLALMTPVHVVYCALRPQDHYRLPLIFHSILLKIIGFRVRVHGVMTRATSVFYVSNHSSYLDIPVLGALIPASFVAKSEVASWPLFGLLAKLQHTVFIERRSVRAATQRDQFTDYLAKGRNLIVFPEGTSSDGHSVLPFKSSLFGAIEDAGADSKIQIQPVSITCTGIDGLPLTQHLRPFYAWYGDMTLVPHLWQVFKCDRFTIDVVFHPPINAKDFNDRKSLAVSCYNAVAAGVEQSVTGRWVDDKPEPVLIPAPV